MSENSPSNNTNSKNYLDFISTGEIKSYKKVNSEKLLREGSSLGTPLIFIYTILSG